MTPYCAFVVLWVVLTTFNFGFGTSELNPLQKALTCSTTIERSPLADLPSCIRMSNAQFGYVTAAFTVGGFVGSLSLSSLKTIISPLKKSKNALIFASLCNVAGGLVRAWSASWPVLAAGRLLLGIGSGVALVVVPAYLNDISPSAMQGSIGVLNQLSIVIGILVAQALGVSQLGDVASPGAWRWVPIVSVAFSLLHVGLSPWAAHAPGDAGNPEVVRGKLWRSARRDTNSGSVEADALLTPDEPDADTCSDHHMSTATTTTTTPSISMLLQLAFSSKRASDLSSARTQGDLRRGTRMIIFTQMAQQLSGINAVLYYSTGILSDALGAGGGGNADADKTARLIGLGVTFVNFVMTFPPIPLIDESRLGRKRLLQISSSTMAISAAVLGFALIYSKIVLASISILLFAAGFSAGLGPIPFLILPELVPRSAVQPASSLGIACNWLANITLATIFLPLKDALGGKVFFIFVMIDTVIFVVITRFYTYSDNRDRQGR